MAVILSRARTTTDISMRFRAKLVFRLRCWRSQRPIAIAARTWTKPTSRNRCSSGKTRAGSTKTLQLPIFSISPSSARRPSRLKSLTHPIIRGKGPLSKPTTAARPYPREPLNLPHCGQPQCSTDENGRLSHQTLFPLGKHLLCVLLEQAHRADVRDG